MFGRAVVALRQPETDIRQSQAPRRLFFELSSDDCCRMRIDIGDDLEAIEGLACGHVVVLESGDLEIPELHLNSKCLAEMPFRVDEVRLTGEASDEVTLLASIPQLDFTPAFPGSSGVIGRQCLLVNSRGRIVAEGLLGWGA